MTGPIEAVVWGAIAASSLLIGAVIALKVRPSDRLVGLVLGFGAGALISAVAYELVPLEGEFPTGIGLALGAGALSFFLGDRVVDRMGGADRLDLDADEKPASGSGEALALGTVLDGIPESLVLGIGVAVGGSVSGAFLVAVFISNLPEAIAATVAFRAAGRSPRAIYGLWLGIAALSALACGLGYVSASAFGATGVFMQAFAAGALLVMIVDTMAPEAVEQGGMTAGLATVLGFAVAGLLAGLE